MKIDFLLNNKKININVDPSKRLIDILRYDLNLTATKEGCGEGECGACTVIINNKLKLACLIPAIKLQDKRIITLEGLKEKKIYNYIQKAFIEEGAIQCGFCTPGFIMSVYSYIENGGNEDEENIKRALSGNICRCTGYEKIIKAVQKAINFKKNNE